MFHRPGRWLVAVLGVLILLGALAAAGTAPFLMRDPDAKSLLLLGLGLCGAGVLAAGCWNAWRVPLLTVRPDLLVVPRFLGTREVALSPGHPVGELLASPDHGGNRPGSIEAGKFVFVFTLDGEGELVELLSLHRAAPMLADVRRALREIAGLEIEQLVRDPGARRPRPDVRHWRRG